MNPSRLFILRPVATTLLMVAILLAGIVAYRVLPLSALPEVDYPTIQVVTLYPGASPDVMTSSVTAPLERQFGQMPGLNQMSSTSSGGASVITLQFSLELSLDVAEQEVQAAINASGNFLPTDLPKPPIYNKVNPADTPIITLALTSKTLPLPKLEDLADTRHRAEDLAAAGRGPRQHQRRPAARGAHPGQSEGARRVRALARRRAHRDRQRQHQPGEGQLRRARRARRRSTPTTSSSPPTNTSSSIIAYKNGAPVRVQDVAEAVDGAENTRLAAWANTTPAIILNIQRQPGTNVIEVVDRVKAAAAAAAGVAARGGRRRAADRPHRHHPRVGRATCSSSCCSPSRWW